jgi:molybdopterin-guanine dinucleotide biosynthesis protein A
VAGIEKVKKETTGFILAGGKSERFGSDKRKYAVKGITLLKRTIRIMRDLLGRHPYIVGDNLSDFQINRKFLLKDAKNDCGPLGGLVAVLEKCPTEWALVLAVDMPEITVAELEFLLSSVDDVYDVITLSPDEMPEPLITLYKRSLVGFWRDRLEENSLSISRNLKDLNVKITKPPGRKERLRNLNRAEDI